VGPIAFRGYFAIDGVEIANSSRVVAHLGRNTPTTDAVFSGSVTEYPTGSGLYTTTGLAQTPGGSHLYGPSSMTESPPGSGLYSLTDCSLVEVSPGLFRIPNDSYEFTKNGGLWTPPDGSRRFGPGLMEVGDCWGAAAICWRCDAALTYDDTWPGLQDFLGDPDYRPELAPWYSTEQPESGEFGGVWVMDVQGLDATPVERTITALVGPGSTAAPHRDAARTLTFDAVLIACTNAGLNYGLKWLACQLRETTGVTDSVLRYLTAHPGHSVVDPYTLVREAHGLVLTQVPTITEAMNTGGRRNQQATVARITWEMTVLSPYAYLPPFPAAPSWTEISTEPISWIHAADCDKPETCEDMPVLFSADCVPERIPMVVTPPPVCGGCVPVGEITMYRYRVPTMLQPFICRVTVVTTRVRNTGEGPFTAQMFWREAGSDVRCEQNQFPLQISGLTPATELTLDGISGRYWAYYDERTRRPVGMVGTPNGAPWRPPVIDRHTAWDFIVQTDGAAEFEIDFILIDRES
jgi:hypothetical protein